MNVQESLKLMQFEAEEMGLDELASAREQGFQEGAAAQLEEANTKLLIANADNLDAQSSKSRADAELSLTKADNTDVDSNKKANESMVSFLESVQKQMELGIPIDINTRDNRAGQVDLVEDTQTTIDPDPNSNQQEIANAAQAQPPQ
jgi:hypothetical protein